MTKIEASWRKFAEVTHTVRTGLKYCAWIAIAYILAGPAIEIAHGAKDLTINLFSAEVSVGDAAKILPWIATVLFGVLYRNERRLRQQNIEQTDEHIKGLETSYDPDRTSSRLTRRGRTNPADELKGGSE